MKETKEPQRMNITKVITVTIDPDLDMVIENQPKIQEGTRETLVIGQKQKAINLPKADSSLDHHHQKKGHPRE